MKPDELIAHDIAALRDEDRMTPDLVFRDPYFLDFLYLTDIHAGKDVEQAILRELEAFIIPFARPAPYRRRAPASPGVSDVWPAARGA